MTSLAYYPKPYFKYKNSSSDGTLLTGSPHTTHNGIPISRKGDKVICKKCKKVTTILTGDPSFIVDGAPIARGGDVTSCGAKLIASQQSFAESGFDVMGVEQAEVIRREAKEYFDKIMGNDTYNDVIQLIDELTKQPLKSLEYIIEHAQGSISGKTDENGNTEKIELSQAEQIKIKIPSIGNSTSDFKIFAHTLTPIPDNTAKQFGILSYAEETVQLNLVN